MRRAAKVDARGSVFCPMCGKEDRATKHRLRKKFCGQTCAAKASGKTKLHFEQEERRRQIAELARQEWAAGGNMVALSKRIGVARSKICVICKEFGITRPRGKAECRNCGKRFNAPKSANRVYCTYECFVAAGGPVEAGYAARRAMKKYGAKKDANHKEVMQAIRAVTAVHDLSAAGCGVPDGLAWVNGGWHLFDIKNPKTGYGRRGLNERQKKWADDWRGGPVFLIYNVEEALAFAKGEWQGIKKFPDDAGFRFTDGAAE